MFFNCHISISDQLYRLSSICRYMIYVLFIYIVRRSMMLWSYRKVTVSLSGTGTESQTFWLSPTGSKACTRWRQTSCLQLNGELLDSRSTGHGFDFRSCSVGPEQASHRISGVTEQLGALRHSLSLGSDCGWLLARMGWHWGQEWEINVF